MKRTRLVWGVIGLALLAPMMIPFQGFSSSCTNDQCYVRASVSWVGVVASIVSLTLAVFHPQRFETAPNSGPVKIWERCVAFFIDFQLAMLALTPITTLPLLLTEAKATGAFQWSFERDFARSSDIAPAIFGILFAFSALAAYFFIHTITQRQTLGQSLLGFRVLGTPLNKGRPAYLLNLLYGIIGLCLWPMTVYQAAKREDKAFGWNSRFGTKAVRVV